MSTPTKFGMGCVPRTSTGLIPSSYRKRMDQMCSPKDWIVLPPQPKPEMYPYRGDYVNERNRKQGAKKIIKKPPIRKAQNVILKSDKAICPKWDTYCQHISSTKLSAEEQDAKAKSKEKILSYMRSEASRRERKVALEKKLQAELENDKPKLIEPTLNPRKPPVPRLSHLARTGKRTKSETDKSEQPENGKNGKTGETVKVESQHKTRYLDFISTKGHMTLPSELMIENRNADKKRSSPCYNYEEFSSQSGFDDSESRFRTNIETIVKQAAAMVIEKIKGDDSHETIESSFVLDTVFNTSSRRSVATHHYSKRLNSGTESQIESRSEKCHTLQKSRTSYLSDISCQLHDIEERMKCISQDSCFMREVKGALQPKADCSCVEIDIQSDSQAFSSASSRISEVTFQIQSSRNDNTEQNQMYLDEVEGSSCANDSDIEIVPRAQIQPTQMDRSWYDNIYAHCKQTGNQSSHDTDAFSWSVSLTNECESAPGKKAPQERSSPQQEPLFDEVRPLTSYSKPIELPVKPVSWDEEPLPRGYEWQSQRDRGFADEIFSLL